MPIFGHDSKNGSDFLLKVLKYLQNKIIIHITHLVSKTFQAENLKNT